MSNTQSIKKNKRRATVEHANEQSVIVATPAPIETPVKIAEVPETVQVKKTKKTSKKMPEPEPEPEPVPIVLKEDNKNELEDVDDDKRYFKCIMINADGVAVSTGRYSGKKPKQAASKACTRLYEDQKGLNNTPEKIIFGMHECTRASKKKKKYFYVGRRVKLAQPEEVHINKIDPKTGNKMIIRYFYNNDVTKLTNDDKSSEYQILYNYDIKEGSLFLETDKKVKTAKPVEIVQVAEPVLEPIKEVVSEAPKTKKARAPRKVKVAESVQVIEPVQVVEPVALAPVQVAESILPETADNIRVIKKKAKGKTTKQEVVTVPNAEPVVEKPVKAKRQSKTAKL